MTGWKTTLLWLAALCLLAPRDARAEGEESPVQLSGTLFGHWGYEFGDQANDFGLDRIYLTARRSLGSDFSVRVTTDVDRPDDSKLRPFIKYAYLEWTGAFEGIKFRLGAAGTPYIGFFDAFWEHRYVAKALSDGNKILSSSDLGVHAIGSHVGGQFSWQAGLLNGEGHGSPEAGASKSVQLRASWDPLAAGGEGSLPVSGFVSYTPADLLTGDATELIYVGSLGYRGGLGIVWVEYVGSLEGEGDDALAGSGYSASLLPRLGGVGSLLLRYDYWDPDTGLDDDGVTTLLSGLTRDMTDHVSAAVLYERTEGENTDDTNHGAFLRMQARF